MFYLYSIYAIYNKNQISPSNACFFYSLNCYLSHPPHYYFCFIYLNLVTQNPNLHGKSKPFIMAEKLIILVLSLIVLLSSLLFIFVTRLLVFSRSFHTLLLFSQNKVLDLLNSLNHFVII
jgi:hypothetical protein